MNSKIVTNGFTMANNELMLKILKDCDASTYVTYLRILSHRNTSNNQCFPTIELLAEECNISISTVKRQLKNLKDKGYLLHKKGNSKYANQYYFPQEPFYKGQGKDQEQPKPQEQPQEPQEPINIIEYKQVEQESTEEMKYYENGYVEMYDDEIENKDIELTTEQMTSIVNRMKKNSTPRYQQPKPKEELDMDKWINNEYQYVNGRYIS